MIPRFDEDLPRQTTLTSLRDIDAESVAYGAGDVINRSYEPLIDVTWDDAGRALEQESRWLATVGDIAGTHKEFELLADQREDEDAEDMHETFRGLDIGVAGLVLTLAAANFAPWSSCRGHPDGRGFACPQVATGADQVRGRILVESAIDAGCGVQAADGALWLLAPSVRELSDCAVLLHQRHSELERLGEPSWKSAAWELLRSRESSGLLPDSIVGISRWVGIATD